MDLKQRSLDMEQSILFFDIDGTILTGDGTRRIPDSTRAGIRQARANEHLVFINTGRVYLNVEPMIREIGFDGYVCGCGTDIYYHGQELFHKQISGEICKQTVAVLRQCNMAALFEASDLNAIDVSIQGNQKLSELVAYFSQEGRSMVDVTSPEFHFDKFTGWYPLKQDMRSFHTYIEPLFDCIDRGQEDAWGMYEVVPKGYSKGTGIQYLLDYFHMPIERAYAFGDSTNDLPMLTYVPHSVAMGESPDAVKQSVEYVTGSLAEDGLAEALKHYGLI